MKSLSAVSCLVVLASFNVGAQNKAKCTKEDAMRAESEASSLQTWSQVYNSYRRFAQCDDAAIGEGYSNSIAHLLSDNWDSIDQLNHLVSHDKNFERFVLHHVDELMSPTQQQKIRENALSHCTRHSSRLCKLINNKLAQTKP